MRFPGLARDRFLGARKENDHGPDAAQERKENHSGASDHEERKASHKFEGAGDPQEHDDPDKGTKRKPSRAEEKAAAKAARKKKK